MKNKRHVALASLIFFVLAVTMAVILLRPDYSLSNLESRFVGVWRDGSNATFYFERNRTFYAARSGFEGNWRVKNGKLGLAYRALRERETSFLGRIRQAFTTNTKNEEAWNYSFADSGNLLTLTNRGNSVSLRRKVPRAATGR